MNKAPVVWHSKKQNTVEPSVFGSEFIVMKTRMETARGLRYKLRMMGIGITSPTYTFGDNMSIIFNTSRPESMLRKKSNSICYHAVQESVAMGEMITGHKPSVTNPAEICTKVLPGGKQQDDLVGSII